MTKKIVWQESDDDFLRENIHSSTQDLAEQLNVSTDSIKKRFAELGIDRPSGKNDLARLRADFLRRQHINTTPPEWHQLPRTRQDAKNEGTTFYWDGAPCARSGHISRRKTSSGGCWECDYGDHKQRLSSDNQLVSARKAHFKSWYDKNREENLAKQKERHRTSEYKNWRREYDLVYRENLDYKISKSLRDRLYKAVSRESKAESAVELVGCSIDELKFHLESLFTEGMSWDNYGDWHIDHIRPCISFDLTDIRQQMECFHYSNLRPLWGYENRSKGGIWEGYDPRGKKKTPR
jgi:hypothetical protein